MRDRVQMFGCPVGGERAKFIANVEAHVVTLLEHDELGWARRGACQALTLTDAYQLIAGAKNHQQRAVDPLRHALECQSSRDVPGLRRSLGVTAHAESLLRSSGHGRQHGAEIEWPAIGDTSFDPRLERGGERCIKGPETLAHHRDVATVNV